MDSQIYTSIMDSFIRLFLVVGAVIVSSLLSVVALYGAILYIRMKKREQISLEMITLEVKLPKDNEIKIDAAEQMFG